MAQASAPLPARANRAAQLTVGLAGAYCALWSYRWLRQGMQGAACAALFHQRELMPPQGPYAEVVLPAALAATVFGAAASWARSLQSRPVTRCVAAVALLTAACLTLVGAVGDRPGAYVPLIFGTVVAAQSARRTEGRPSPPPRHPPRRLELPFVRQDLRRRPPTPEPLFAATAEPLLAGDYEVV